MNKKLFSFQLLSNFFPSLKIGTTVQVLNIFHTLPVRHREFQKNIKREFAKLIQVLNAYCIVNTGVRISCSNMTAKGYALEAVCQILLFCSIHLRVFLLL